MDGRLGFKRGFLEFLGYVVQPDSCRVYDKIEEKYVINPEALYILLAHYSEAGPIEKVGRLIGFRDLPGGYAYEEAFAQRAAFPMVKMFESRLEILVKQQKSWVE